MRLLHGVPALLFVFVALACREPMASAGQPTGSGGADDLPLNASSPIAVAGGPYFSDATVRFDGLGSLDPDGNLPLIYAWDFGDGSTGSQATPTHTYSADGIYAVKLTVTDAAGNRSAPGTATARISGSVAAPTILAGAGNIATCKVDRDEATAQLLDEIPGWVAAIGDNAFPNGTLSDYQSCYEPTWGRHRSRTFAALGNHEYGTGNADGTFDYFGERAGPRGLGYYSFDLGDWHVIVLNDNSEYVPYHAGSDQDTWLQTDLAENPSMCTLAMWHAPLFMSSNAEGFTELPSHRIIWERLYAADADLVLNAQQHHYERMAPMNPHGERDDVRGIRQFNVGSGGESIALPTVAIHANSEVRSDAFGVLKLTLHSNGYDWEFVPVAGESFSDAGSGQCH